MEHGVTTCCRVCWPNLPQEIISTPFDIILIRSFSSFEVHQHGVMTWRRVHWPNLPKEDFSAPFDIILVYMIRFLIYGGSLSSQPISSYSEHVITWLTSLTENELLRGNVDSFLIQLLIFFFSGALWTVIRLQNWRLRYTTKRGIVRICRRDFEAPSPPLSPPWARVRISDREVGDRLTQLFFLPFRTGW